MGKLIQIYAVVCVTIDAETGKGVKIEGSDASEMPVNRDDVWDVDAREWFTPTSDQGLRWGVEADDMTRMALMAFEDLTEAQKVIVRWDGQAAFPLEQKATLNATEHTAEESLAAWKFKDGSTLLVSNDGTPMEAR